MSRNDISEFMKLVRERDTVSVENELEHEESRRLVNTLHWEDVDDCVAPLHRAAALGDIPMMRLLVDYGADITMRAGDDEMNGHCIGVGPFRIKNESSGDCFLCATPLHYAAWHGKRAAGQWLVDRGAQHDPHTVAGLGCATELAAFLAQGADRNAGVLLQWAAAAGAEESVPLLLNYHSGPAVMTEAIQRAFASGHYGVALQLHAGGAQLLPDPDSSRLNDRVLHGDRDGVEFLIRIGADVNRGPEDCHPLVQAACKGHLDIVKLLLEAGSRPDIAAEFFPETTSGQFSQAVGTPLQAAIMCGYDQVAAFLQEWNRKHGAGGPEPKSAEELLDMWVVLSDRLRLSAGKDQRLAAGRELIDMYSADPRRAYHNLAHVSACLAELEQAGAMSSDTNLVAAALWFHDAVYEPAEADNELCSARLAVKVLEQLGMAPDRRRKVARLINATSHLDEPESYDEELICDIDLAILGKPWSQYSRYAAAVRWEYSLPCEQYNDGRETFLRNMLTRQNIYHTRRFRDAYEQTARENMQHELVELEE